MTRLTQDREALFVRGTGQRYTYAHLNPRANRVATFLHQALGVQKGARVSIFRKLVASSKLTVLC